MAVVTLKKESVSQNGFYTPQFQVRIAGAGLPQDVLRDVIQLTYTDNIKEIDRFEITVNNWDPTTRSFKYVGGDTESALFDPCHEKVEVRMGYVGDLTVMMTGRFTTLEPNFPSSGAPTLTVRGLNVLHELRRKQYTTSWTGLTDSQIAKNIETLRDPDTGRKRFPIPLVIDPNESPKETPLEYVAQQTQYDIDFLFQRARQRGYVVFVQESPTRQLYFGPSNGTIPTLRKDTFELLWGESLIDFKPTLTTANQVRSVTVNGWNRRTKKPIRESVNLDDPRLNRNRDLYSLLKRCDPRDEEVSNEPVFTPKHARERAIAILQERQKDMVKCTATTVGLPDLRAGTLVRIMGVGPRFSGSYFITETTHAIGGSGYTTKFSARREDGGKPK